MLHWQPWSIKFSFYVSFCFLLQYFHHWSTSPGGKQKRDKRIMVAELKSGDLVFAPFLN